MTVTYSVWAVQGIAKQRRGQGGNAQQAKQHKAGFINTLSQFLEQGAEKVAPLRPAGNSEMVYPVIYPRLREVNAVDTDHLTSEKQMLKYMA